MASEDLRVLCRVKPNDAELPSRRVLNFPSEHSVRLATGIVYTFDRVFTPNDSQAEVYEGVQSIVCDFVDAYNGTIIAFGPTGSGKTFTMKGKMTDNSSMGIMPRIADDIFTKIESLIEFEFTVKVSFHEIYQENILDLLDDREKEIKLYEKGNNVHIVGAKELVVANRSELLQQLVRGFANRKTLAAESNEQSSLSHVVFQVTIKRTHKSSHKTFTAKLFLVDLAGSDRLRGVDTSSSLYTDSVAINLSLHQLSRVLESLASKEKHIPFRDSVLTQLLKDGLGGNSKTILILCVTNSSDVHTKHTLDFGCRVKGVSMKEEKNYEKLLLEKVTDALVEIIMELRKIRNEKPSEVERDFQESTATEERAEPKKLTYPNYYPHLDYCSRSFTEQDESQPLINQPPDLTTHLTSKPIEPSAVNPLVVLAAVNQPLEEKQSLVSIDGINQTNGAVLTEPKETQTIISRSPNLLRDGLRYKSEPVLPSSVNQLIEEIRLLLSTDRQNQNNDDAFTEPEETKSMISRPPDLVTPRLRYESELIGQSAVNQLFEGITLLPTDEHNQANGAVLTELEETQLMISRPTNLATARLRYKSEPVLPSAVNELLEEIRLLLSTDGQNQYNGAVLTETKETQSMMNESPNLITADLISEPELVDPSAVNTLMDLTVNQPIKQNQLLMSTNDHNQSNGAVLTELEETQLMSSRPTNLATARLRYKSEPVLPSAVNQLLEEIRLLLSTDGQNQYNGGVLTEPEETKSMISRPPDLVTPRLRYESELIGQSDVNQLFEGITLLSTDERLSLSTDGHNQSNGAVLIETEEAQSMINESSDLITPGQGSESEPVEPSAVKPLVTLAVNQPFEESPLLLSNDERTQSNEHNRTIRVMLEPWICLRRWALQTAVEPFLLNNNPFVVIRVSTIFPMLLLIFYYVIIASSNYFTTRSEGNVTET